MQLMKQARGLALAALGAAGLAVAAAGPALASCAGAPEQSKVTMLADWLIWAQQGPMVSARINGLYEAAGLEVEIVAPANPVDNVKMAAARNVAFAMVDQIEFLLARQQGIPVTSIGAMIRDNTAGLVYLGDAPIAGPADLKGKTIGVNPRPDLDAQVDLILEGGGLTRADVKIVDPGYGAVELLVSGRLDAVWTSPKFTEDFRFGEATKKAGKAPIEWIYSTDYGRPDMYFYILIANQDWLEENPNTACHFMQASAAGAEAMLADPDPVIDEIARITDFWSRDFHHAFYKGAEPHWKDAHGKLFTQDRELWLALQAWLVEAGIMEKTEDPALYFTNAFLPG